MAIPYALRPLVEQWREDWRVLSAAWIQAGVHDEDEIAYMREVIVDAMVSETPPMPEIDSRPQEVRIRSWCQTMAALRDDLERDVPRPRNAIAVEDMVLDSKRAELKPMDWARAFAGGRR